MNIHRDPQLREAARLTLNNGQHDAEAVERMAAYGFGPAQWQTGQQLLQRLEECISQCTTLEHERWALSQQINEGQRAIVAAFKEHAKAAHFAFRHDPSLLHSLEVSRISRRRWESIKQAAFFYRQLASKKLSLQAYGISPKAVQQTIKDIDALMHQREQRTHRKARGEHNTQQKQAAYAALREWLVEFRGVARLAFRRQPQLLEMFGIPVRSTVRTKVLRPEGTELASASSEAPAGK